jgi:hypothetical protein
MEHITPTHAVRLRRDAKAIKRQGVYTHTEALDAIAKRKGYSNWSHLIGEVRKNYPLSK